MKKNTLLYIIITILLVVIAVGITYIVIDKKNNPSTTKENNKANENDNKNNEEEKITLSEEELEKYISYVPNDFNNNSVYQKNNTNINSINKDLLRDMALIEASKCLDINKSTCPFDTSRELIINIDSLREEQPVATSYVPLTYVNELLSKMYNYELNNIKNATNIEDKFFAGGMGYIYQDEYFILIGGGTNWKEHISLIEKYETNNNELVIYEFAAYYNEFNNKIGNYFTNEESDFGGWCGNTSKEEKNDLLINYLKEHKNKYPKYKHTFKKNRMGYYWYSTEVVE